MIERFLVVTAKFVIRNDIVGLLNCVVSIRINVEVDRIYCSKLLREGWYIPEEFQ